MQGLLVYMFLLLDFLKEGKLLYVGNNVVLLGICDLLLLGFIKTLQLYLRHEVLRLTEHLFAHRALVQEALLIGRQFLCSSALVRRSVVTLRLLQLEVPILEDKVLHVLRVD